MWNKSTARPVPAPEAGTPRTSPPGWRASMACSAASTCSSWPGRPRFASPCGTPRTTQPNSWQHAPGSARLQAQSTRSANTSKDPPQRSAATHARLLYFDGPRTPEQVAASDFGGRQRVWPAIRELSGLVSVYLLRGHDLGWIVVTFATSVDTLDTAQRTVMATDLLPGEDRALLPGPDRIEIHKVTGYQVQPAGQHATISHR